MDENPYRAPREPGVTPAKLSPFPARGWLAAGATVVNLVLCGEWMIETARTAEGLAWWQALGPTAMMAVSFFGLAATIWENRRLH